MFRSLSQRRMALEVLESRKQMAGVVELALDGGNWTFTGDGSANGVEIELVAQGEYFVRGTSQGGAPTTIKIAGFDNLAATEFHIFSELNSATANLGGAGDRLRIVGRGPGSDALRVGSLVANLSDGDDTLELKYVSATGITVDLGAGSDKLSMIGVTTNSWGWYYAAFTSILAGSGKDRVEIEESRLGPTRIDTGADGDELLLDGVTGTRTFEIFTGSGDDVVAIVGSSFSSRLTLDTGADDDQAAMFAVSADEIYADMGDGDDYLYLVANSAQAAKLLGGAGKDILDFDPFLNVDNEFETLGTDGFEILQ
jgi:hypothetical protein